MDATNSSHNKSGEKQNIIIALHRRHMAAHYSPSCFGQQWGQASWLAWSVCNKWMRRTPRANLHDVFATGCGVVDRNGGRWNFHVSLPTVHAVRWNTPRSTVWLVVLLWMRCVHRLFAFLLLFFFFFFFFVFISHLQLPTSTSYTPFPAHHRHHLGKF